MIRDNAMNTPCSLGCRILPGARMISKSSKAPIGLLLSGGLDSCILLGHLLQEKRPVQPFYIRSQLAWQPEELLAVERFLGAVDSPLLKGLVVLDLPLQDLYADHWSVTGQEVPSADSPDDAVYLPGRNALLAIKAALWCRLHDIGELALAVLRSNPFSDATDEFFDAFESALDIATSDRATSDRATGGRATSGLMLLGYLHRCQPGRFSASL